MNLLKKSIISKVLTIAVIFSIFSTTVGISNCDAFALSRGLINSAMIEKLQEMEESEPQTNAINSNLPILDLGEDFLFNTNPSVAQNFFSVFNEFDAALQLNGFDFNKASMIAANNGMTASGSINNAINQGSNNVNYVMQQIDLLFANNLNSKLSSNAKNVFSKVIQDTFNTHISSSNYVVYSSKSGGSNSYLYKILAGSVTLDGNKATLTLVPIEIKVDVSVKIKKVLFIKVKNSKHYDVNVKAAAYKKIITL